MESAVQNRPSLLDVARFWGWVGTVSWGGLYAVLPKIKAQLAEREWVSSVEFDTIMAAATLVPGPSFVSLSGLVGYKVRGAAGSLVAMISLMLPPTILVAGALIFLISGDNGTGPLAAVTRIVTIAMAGVILGNAWKIMRGAKLHWAGVLLLVGVGAAIMAGFSVMWSVIIALVIGRFLIGGAKA
ncbi:MAG: chromate transporter [Mycobacterium leprae]